MEKDKKNIAKKEWKRVGRSRKIKKSEKRKEGGKTDKNRVKHVRRRNLNFIIFCFQILSKTEFYG